MRRHLPVMAKTVPIIMAALCLVLAPAANACPTQSAAARLNALRMSAMLRPAPAQDAATQATDNNNGGTHTQPSSECGKLRFFPEARFSTMLSNNSMPMASKCRTAALSLRFFDNVCWGLWRQIDAKTFKLKHFGWTFDADGNNVGTFLLTATITVGSGGNSYSGTYVADIVLPSGQIDPSQHVTGPILATRLTLD